MDPQLSSLLPTGPCNDGVTLVIVARCVEGVWQFGTMDLSEIGTGPTPAAVVHAAVVKGWAARDVCKLADTLKPCKCNGTK